MTPKTGVRWNVDLRGPDGNAYVILGVVSDVIEKRIGPEEAKLYRQRAMSGDYDNLLAVTREYVQLRELGPALEEI